MQAHNKQASPINFISKILTSVCLIRPQPSPSKSPSLLAWTTEKTPAWVLCFYPAALQILPTIARTVLTKHTSDHTWVKILPLTFFTFKSCTPYTGSQSLCFSCTHTPSPFLPGPPPLGYPVLSDLLMYASPLPFEVFAATLFSGYQLWLSSTTPSPL